MKLEKNMFCPLYDKLEKRICQIRLFINDCGCGYRFYNPQFLHSLNLFVPFFFPFYPSRMGNHLYRRLISFLLIENVFIKKCSQIIFFHNTFLLLFFYFFENVFFFLFSENIFCQDAFNYTLL